jgi:hypothetical protein
MHCSVAGVHVTPHRRSLLRSNQFRCWSLSSRPCRACLRGTQHEPRASCVCPSHEHWHTWQRRLACEDNHSVVFSTCIHKFHGYCIVALHTSLAALVIPSLPLLHCKHGHNIRSAVGKSLQPERDHKAHRSGSVEDRRTMIATADEHGGKTWGGKGEDTAEAGTLLLGSPPQQRSL